jgi:hypothetical protein
MFLSARTAVCQFGEREQVRSYVERDLDSELQRKLCDASVDVLIARGAANVSVKWDAWKK